MVAEVLDALAPAPGEKFLDLTLGAGGHAAEIAARLGEKGVLVGMDWDAAILDMATKRLAGPGLARCRICRGNFLDARDALDEADVGRVDGILLDLGVSSLQLEDPERGFSFAQDGPLDMRMDRERQSRTAADIVNRAPEYQLERILREYGQERFARRIARRIVQARRAGRITRTGQLADLVVRARARRKWQRIHPATRVFQALRIAVNEELENLEGILEIAPELLERGGRIAVIAFHSLEDRIVKEDFRNRAHAGIYSLITKKPLRASPAEVSSNPRSRSARLRAAKRSQG